MKRIFVFIFSLLMFLTTSCSFHSAYILNATFDRYTISNYGNSQDVAFFPSVGENNLLVVPILFKNNDLEDTEWL